MFGSLFGDKVSKAKEMYRKTLALALEAQRSGDVKQYIFLMEKAEIYRKEGGL